MKMEISIEEKARRYDEAYKKVAVRFGSNVADEIFPELRESEDERIRKAIKLMYSFLPNEPTYIGDVPVKDIFAWLEKQGEQKPVDIRTTGYWYVEDTEQKPAWSEEDEENFNWFEKFFRAESVVAEGKDIPQDKYLWFKNLKGRVQSQSHWKPSDEQIKACKEVYADILSAKGFDLGTVNSELNRLEEELKKLKA